MKVTIAGKTPMERLINLTKRIIVVPKEEIEQAEQQWRRTKKRKRKT
jgi:hypothetical protein